MGTSTDGNAEMVAIWDGPEGDHWASHADRYEAASIQYTSALITALEVGSDSAVLDIGCGTGKTSIEIGRRAPQGRVLGVDLSVRMLAVGREAAAAEKLDRVQFEQADAQAHNFEPGSFDRAVSCFGAMFFADPIAALTNIRRALRPDGKVLLLAWRDLVRNEWVADLRKALAAGRTLPTPEAGAPGPFGMADRDITAGWLASAGYVDIDISSVDEPLCFGRDADDAYSFVSTLGITRGLTADLDEATRSAALDRLHQTLKDHETDDGVLFAGSAWLIHATNPNKA